jgi:hypothetical protein
MDRLDRMIAEALDDEDRALLDSIEEPGFFALGLGQFRGKLGWVTWVLMAVQTVMFLAAVWCGWHFYTATELLPALKWGLTAAVLAVLATQLKMALVPQMQADRVLRALRRVELMVLQTRKRD